MREREKENYKYLTNLFRWIVQGTPKAVITGELWRVVSDWVHPEEEMVAYRSVVIK